MAGTLVAVLAIGAAIFLLMRPGPGSPVEWSRLGTQDVHSLAFVGGDSALLLFGHHGGISASGDGGRTWQLTGSRSDAMTLAIAGDGSLVVAGHDVFEASRDGGQTWQPIEADLPSLDIHGFTRDPGDPARMWAYLATGGFWESRDGGSSWVQVQRESVLFPVAVRVGSTTRVFGITASGLAVSDDGGATWGAVATPELYPIASLAATPDGSVLLAGGPDGLARSDDGGLTWSQLPFEEQPAAVAVAPGGRSIAVVTRSTAFYRSDDGGQSWPGP